MADIKGRESPEMYLKEIYLIRKRKGYCRHIDLANQLKVSKPSVTAAVGLLLKENFVGIDEDGMIVLTEKGTERAEMICEKFRFWENILKILGLDSKSAENEACKMEHALSDEAFLQIKQNASLNGLC